MIISTTIVLCFCDWHDIHDLDDTLLNKNYDIMNITYDDMTSKHRILSHRNGKKLFSYLFYELFFLYDLMVAKYF